MLVALGVMTPITPHNFGGYERVGPAHHGTHQWKSTHWERRQGQYGVRMAGVCVGTNLVDKEVIPYITSKLSMDKPMELQFTPQISKRHWPG